MMNFMGKQVRGKHSILLLAGLLVLFALSACASNSATANCSDNNRVSQAFSFDAPFESPDITLIDYFYGTPNCPSMHNTEGVMRLQSENTFGPIRRAQKLYVQWQIKSTGQILEDTVDLRQRLPKDMTKHRLHFIVRNTQLFVFVVTPEFRHKDLPPDDGPEVYSRLRKTLTIYPDQSK